MKKWVMMGLIVLLYSSVSFAARVPPPPPLPSDGSCSAEWQCQEWGACNNGKQVRTCTDIKQCFPPTAKPSEMQSCTVIEVFGNVTEIQTNVLDLEVVLQNATTLVFLSQFNDIVHYILLEPLNLSTVGIITQDRGSPRASIVVTNLPGMKKLYLPQFSPKNSVCLSFMVPSEQCSGIDELTLGCDGVDSFGNSCIIDNNFYVVTTSYNAVAEISDTIPPVAAQATVEESVIPQQDSIVQPIPFPPTVSEEFGTVPSQDIIGENPPSQNNNGISAQDSTTDDSGISEDAIVPKSTPRPKVPVTGKAAELKNAKKGSTGVLTILVWALILSILGVGGVMGVKRAKRILPQKTQPTEVHSYVQTLTTQGFSKDQIQSQLESAGHSNAVIAASMTTPKDATLDYVRAMAARGFTTKQIQAQLLKANYTPLQIHELFLEVNHSV